MLKEFGTVFLDGTEISDIEKELDCRIHVAHGGDDFIKILGRNNG
jgi:hypothetical protein